MPELSINTEMVAVVAHLYSVTQASLPFLTAMRNNLVAIHELAGAQMSKAALENLGYIEALIDETNRAVAMADQFMQAEPMGIVMRKPAGVH